MIASPNLVPECNVDTVFVEMLGHKNPNHASSISEVSKTLEGKINAIGFIDDDKRKPPFLLEFNQTIAQINKVRLLKHANKNLYLVAVKPAMDKFIFDLCKDLEIDLKNYGLPSELKAFISCTKKESIRRDTKFKNLLNTLLQKQPEEIVQIKSWIRQYSPYKDI
jgi:hypothetical protein